MNTSIIMLSESSVDGHDVNAHTSGTSVSDENVIHETTLGSTTPPNSTTETNLTNETSIELERPLHPSKDDETTIVASLTDNVAIESAKNVLHEMDSSVTCNSITDAVDVSAVFNSSSILDGSMEEDPESIIDIEMEVISPTTAVKGVSATRALGKRPSPWREPRVGPGMLPPPARESNSHYKSTAATVSGHKKQSQEMMEQQQRETAERQRRRQERRCAYLCSGSITVHIPLSVTADLGIALRRGRNHRIAALYRHFPMLQPNNNSNNSAIDTSLEHDTAAANENGENGKAESEPPASAGSSARIKKKTVTKKPLRHVPQPHEYASVIDYLEAKYVQGVVISDDHDDIGSGSGGGDGQDDDDDEGNGSVYSETSFLDDTGLQRTIAEQVMGHTTTTKLELMNTNVDDDDAAFFVNVGDLEVEETDLTQEMYDPLDDSKKDLNAMKKKTRKRKKHATDTTASKEEVISRPNGMATFLKPSSASSSHVFKKSLSMVKSPPVSPKTKKIKVQEEDNELHGNKSPKIAKISLSKPKSVTNKDAAVLKLQKISSKKKEEILQYFRKLEVSIKALTDDELPRKAKPKRTRVVVKVPPDNKAGDMITFANPHVPGQKLKVKVPVNTRPGETFKVTVPKPPDEEEEIIGDDEAGRDHNKFNRDFYDELDDYAKAYDDWCEAEGAYRKAINDKSFTPHFMKRNKCDDLVPLFPTDTKTQINVEYLKKVIRRARQNKHKRELTLARQQQPPFPGEKNDDAEENNSDSGSGSDEDNEDDSNKGSSDEDENDVEKAAASYHKLSSSQQVSKKTKPTRTAVLPLLSRTFPSKQFRLRDFTEVS
jgi:hypothetical protein